APRSTRPGVLGRPPAAGGRCSRCRVRGSHGGLARGSWAVRSPLKAVSALDWSISSTFSLSLLFLFALPLPPLEGGDGARARTRAAGPPVSLSPPRVSPFLTVLSWSQCAFFAPGIFDTRPPSLSLSRSLSLLLDLLMSGSSV